MAKIRTEAALQARLDANFGWRITEISELKAAFIAAHGNRKSIVLRATIPLCYAHWEGFVKKSAIDYCVYVSTVCRNYSEVKSCFYGIQALGLVSQIGDIRKKIATSSRIASSIIGIQSERVSLDLKPYLENLGNLNHELFLEVVEFLNISPLPYLTKKVFIDESLVAARNSIAHGERELIDQSAGIAICDEVVGLVRRFKSDLEDAATRKTFLA